MIQMSALSPLRSVRKTIERPSGDQPGWLDKLGKPLFGVVVIWWLPVPSALTTQISLSPSGPARYATFDPSGDHAACAWRVSSATSRVHAPPPGSTVYSRLALVNSTRPLSPGNAACAGAARASRTRRTSTSGMGSRYRGLFAHDLARRLVEAQAQEGGVAQPAVRGPFHERDLRHELGLDPGRNPRNALLGLERGRLAHQRREPLGELLQGRAREARPDLAGVAETIAVVVADEQGAEIGARPPRRSEAADDQLLRARALELEPVARPGGDVGRAEALGDQPLPAVTARLGQERRAVAGHLVGDAQRVSPVQHALEHLPALLERKRPHVAASREQHVEDVVEELRVFTAAEAIATADERARLAVEHEAVGAIGIQCRRDRRVA